MTNRGFITIKISAAASEKSAIYIRVARIESVYPLAASFRNKLSDPTVRTGVKTFSGELICTTESVESVIAKMNEVILSGASEELFSAT